MSRCARLAWEACQTPFSRGSPISFQALENRMKVSGERRSNPRVQRQNPTPTTVFQGPSSTGADGPRMALNYPLPHPRREIFRTSERLLLRRSEDKKFSIHWLWKESTTEKTMFNVP